MKKQNTFRKIMAQINNHRIVSAVLLIIVIVIGYYSYKKIYPTVTVPQYTLSMTRIGSITQTVTGSGQVSASNQTDIQSQVSGTIKTINVSVGQAVRTGDLIATIDSTNALIPLQNAKLSYAKTVQPAKETDISNSQNNLAKAYDSGFNSIAGTFLDLPTILNGTKDMLYSQTGFLSNQNATSLSSTGRTYRDATEKSYISSLDQYQKTLQKYNSVTRNSPTSSIDSLLADTYATIKAVSETAKSAQSAINFTISSQPDYLKSSANTALSNINSWANMANSDVSNIVSAQNSILNSTNSLSTLMAGSDSLDIESARLSLEQAQRTYNNYFIKAPYDGIIGRIPVNVYSQAGSATAIATIIGQQKIATISLNEVDAAKVKVGQTVNITFDAIDSLAATGTVSVVDQIGTVSSGVVSYGVKILINTDDSRIKPGMSVNTTIITLQKDNVLIVPSAAIKKQGNAIYVQTFAPAVIQAAVSPNPSGVAAFTARGNYSASTTRVRNFTSSTTDAFAGTTTPNGAYLSASSTGSFSGNQSTGLTARTMTISTTATPDKVTVTTGDSDDTNIEVVSGLNRGQFVITKTTAASSATTSTAPSILSGLSGNRTKTTTSTSGATRTTGSAGVGAGGPPPGM